MRLFMSASHSTRADAPYEFDEFEKDAASAHRKH